jgi:multicomponent Na+:H+ antiporter subunit G
MGSAVKEAVVIALSVIGLAFSLSGVMGILRMPDVYSRIQCSSKTITMGALPVLIAIVIGQGPVSNYGSRALLVAVLLLVVNPVSSHALARAAYKAGVPIWPGSVTDQPRDRRRPE